MSSRDEKPPSAAMPPVDEVKLASDLQDGNETETVEGVVDTIISSDTTQVDYNGFSQLLEIGQDTLQDLADLEEQIATGFALSESNQITMQGNQGKIMETQDVILEKVEMLADKSASAKVTKLQSQLKVEKRKCALLQAQLDKKDKQETWRSASPESILRDATNAGAASQTLAEVPNVAEHVVRNLPEAKRKAVKIRTKRGAFQF